MICEEPVHSPQAIVEHYRQAFLRVHHREPLVRYMGNHWFYVNGETVHKAVLIGEIDQLQDLARKQLIFKAERSVVQRLIARLRGL